MQLAQKFSRPIVVFIDTPAAYPGVESEERGVAEAIAFNLREMMMLEVPIVIIVCGEGGSGGALGIAIGDRVLMQEFSVYSVIPPEGCAAILWRDANRKVEAAAALKITAPDLLSLGLIDAIVPEPTGGAHNDYDAATALVDQALAQALAELSRLSVAELLAGRYDKFRRMGGKGRRSSTSAHLERTVHDRRAGARRTPRRRRVRTMKTLLWQHLPCDDDEASALAAALNLHPTVARLLCLRGFGEPAVADRFLNPSLDHLHDPFLLDRHGPGRDAARAGAGERGADRDPRRLRRRRHHVDGHPAARARDARRERRPLHPRTAARRLRPPAGGDRSAARRQGRCHRVGRLRHPRDRRGAARARARRSI